MFELHLLLRPLHPRTNDSTSPCTCTDYQILAFGEYFFRRVSPMDRVRIFQKRMLHETLQVHLTRILTQWDIDKYNSHKSQISSFNLCWSLVQKAPSRKLFLQIRTLNVRGEWGPSASALEANLDFQTIQTVIFWRQGLWLTTKVNDTHLTNYLNIA